MQHIDKLEKAVSEEAHRRIGCHIHKADVLEIRRIAEALA